MADDRVSIWNQYLKAFRQPTSGEVMFGNGTDFTLGSLSAAIDAAFPAATQGSILYRGATDWTYLPPGSAGQLLESGGPSANPGWSSGYSPPSIANNTIVSNVSGSPAAASANTLTQVLDSVAGNAQGSILYRSNSAWTVLAPGASGQFLQTNGTGANPSWGGSTTVFKGSDQSIANTVTYTDVTDLSFSVAANTNYTFTCVFYSTFGNGTIDVAMNGPSSPTSIIFGISGFFGKTAYDSTLASVAVNNPGALVGEIYGYIQNGANSGTVIMRFKQAGSSANNTTIKAGSYIKYAEGP